MGLLISRIISIAVSLYFCMFVAFSLNQQLVVMEQDTSRLQSFNIALLSILGVLAGYLFGNLVYEIFRKEHERLREELKHYSPYAVASGSVGLGVGLLIANLMLIPMYLIEFSQTGKIVIAAGVSLLFAYLGVMVAGRLNLWSRADLKWRQSALEGARGVPKIIDSSTLIDGRVLELARLGFMEGPVLIPKFILDELQKLADSSESLTRNKGRRGLDIIQRMQDDSAVELEILEESFNKMYGTVDNHLVELCKQVHGWLVSNDFNLGKVAKLQGIQVLNLNELSQAIRPMFLPGETIRVNVIKYGKEVGQGVAYLDDGTMVVIESGDAFVGDTLDVEITSIIQTVAGRLLFAKPKER